MTYLSCRWLRFSLHWKYLKDNGQISTANPEECAVRWGSVKIGHDGSYRRTGLTEYSGWPIAKDAYNEPAVHVALYRYRNTPDTTLPTFIRLFSVKGQLNCFSRWLQHWSLKFGNGYEILMRPSKPKKVSMSIVMLWSLPCSILSLPVSYSKPVRPFHCLEYTEFPFQFNLRRKRLQDRDLCSAVL